jgi:flagellar biosynthesis/type III secretory pathway protein FliH
MGLVILHNSRITAAHKGRVIKAAWVPVVKETQAALDQLAAIVADEKAAGFAEGKAKGEAEAKQIVTQKLVALEQKFKTHSQTLRTQSASLAVEIVRKIAPSLGISNLVPALAEQIVATLTLDSKIKIYVHPNALIETRMKFIPLDMHVEVISDADSDEFSCRIETSLGVIDGGLETQLEVLRQAFVMSDVDQA